MERPPGRSVNPGGRGTKWEKMLGSHPSPTPEQRRKQPLWSPKFLMRGLFRGPGSQPAGVQTLVWRTVPLGARQSDPDLRLYLLVIGTSDTEPSALIFKPTHGPTLSLNRPTAGVGASQPPEPAGDYVLGGGGLALGFNFVGEQIPQSSPTGPRCGSAFSAH